jgi:hypothetical protein
MAIPKARVIYCAIRGQPQLEFRCFMSTTAAMEFETLAWVDWFNMRRLLEPIGYVPPAEYEAQYYQQAAVACQPTRSRRNPVRFRLARYRLLLSRPIDTAPDLGHP